MKDQLNPIQKISYSAIRQFLQSPAKFYQHYIVGEQYPPSMSMLVGRAWHKGLEEFYKGNSSYIQAGIDELVVGYDEILNSLKNVAQKEDMGVKFKKEAEDLERNLELYATSERSWSPSEHIEAYAAMPSPVDGALPISGRIDILDKDGNPVDHKYVHRKESFNPYKYMPQAWFYYYIAKEITGKYPACFRIDEWKKTTNRDKSPQLTERVLMYEKKWMTKLDKWFEDICYQILRQYRFPANPFTPFGDEDWRDYIDS